MFIFVTYKDSPELSTVRRRSSLTSDPEVDLSVEKTLLVNPYCPARIMLEYIRKKCRLGIFTNFDLCDELGAMKGLFSMETFKYATDLFEHKKTYYVIVLKMENDKRISLIPQLNHDNRLFVFLKDRCKQYLMTTTTPSSSPPRTNSVVLPLAKITKKR